jgi:hypothetical protein
MRHLDFLGFDQVDKDHQRKEKRDFFLHSLIVPLHPENPLILGEDEIALVINRQNEPVTRRMVNCLRPRTHMRGMKSGEFLPVYGIRRRLSRCLFLHPSLLT